MRLRLSLILALLVNGLARGDDLERSIPAACPADGSLAHPAVAPGAARSPAEAGDACFARALDARVGDVLDRSAERAEARAMALLEARVAGRPDEVAGAVALRVDQQLAAATARELPRQLDPQGTGRVPPTRVARLAPFAVDADPLEVGSPPRWSGVILKYR